MEARYFLLKCFTRIRNQEGFTLVESLLALFISTSVLMLVGATFRVLMKTEEYLGKSKNNIEWHIFLNQTEHDVLNKKLKNVYPYEIILEEAGSLDTITYAQHGSKIRWQRNRAGYVPVLNRVKQVKFQNQPTGLLIDVTFTNEQNLKGLIPLAKE